MPLQKESLNRRLKLGVARSVSFTSSWKGHEEEEFFVQLLKAESANSVGFTLDAKYLFPMESNIDFSGIDYWQLDHTS